MTGSPFDAGLRGSCPAEEARATVGLLPQKPAARRWVLLLFAGAAADVGLAFLGLNPLKGFLILAPFAVLGLYALCCVAAVRAVGAEGVVRRIASLAALAERRRGLATALPVGIGIAGALIAVWVLRAFPNSGDEYAYLFEARTFLAGRLGNPPPPLPALFAHYYIICLHGKWVATYPPGWPLLLAAVMSLRLPSWLAAPLYGGVLLYAVLMLGQKRGGALGGVLAAALVAISPFFLFNAASYFDNLPAAAAGLLFCWAAFDFLDHPRWPNALCAGLALGMLGLIRSQDVVLFGAPFAVELLVRARRRHYLVAPAIVLAGLPFLAALLFYNHVVLGSLVPDITQFSGTHFGLFPVDEAENHLTPLNELSYVAGRMILLADWTSPLLVFGYAVAFAVVAYRRRLSFVDFIFPTFILGFMFVPFWGGNQYGPRYYFEGFPFLVLTLVSALAPLLRDPEYSRWRPLTASLLVAHGAACLAAMAIIAPFLRTVVDQRMDLYDQVKAQNLHEAVVVIRSRTGKISSMSTLDLTRNGIVADGKVLYVLNIPDQIDKLRRLLPQRRFYIYERDPASAAGSLRRLP
jgi:hypothetical protein